MKLDEIKAALLTSYETDGGINHLDGVNLPSQESVNEISRDCMHLLFPGYFEEAKLEKKDVPRLVDTVLARIGNRLEVEIEKSLRFARDPEPKRHARVLAEETLATLPDLRKAIRTDVEAAYQGDPAALSYEEIIVAYPCVLAISLQRFAHVLYSMRVPLLPRMITEFAHERTGIDIHPGAKIGTHFFIDHGTGVVVGETAIIGDDVKLYQGVTIGALSVRKEEGDVKRHPTIEDEVTIYSGATILGGRTVVGRGSVIGGNVWLTHSVPPFSRVYLPEGDSARIEERFMDGGAFI